MNEESSGFRNNCVVSCCLWRMGSNCAEKIPSNHSTESAETTIEIKIKTLDSQTYTLKVDKQMPVPALKEQIASLTGVLSEQQRLICQGKVLKDDQLLSAYHVEDGHTLHLVARQPNLTPLGTLLNHSATEPNLNTSHGHSTQLAPGVFVETFNLPVQNQSNGIPLEINRIVSAVLGSIGLSNFTSGGEGIVVREHNSQGLERTSGSIDISDLSHPQPNQPGLRLSLDRLRSMFGPSAAVTLESLQPPVIPDSLTTLSQYLSHMSQEFDAIVREVGNNVQTADAHRSEEMESASSRMGSVPESLPSPASLAEVLLSTRQMITQQAGECILQLARQLENQADVTDPLLRSSTQSRALRAGVLFYNLGALLLELGRTTMTLRLGQAPSEAVVNGGPAVFISPTGPNHIMVQPLPFQPGASFGAVPVGAAQSNSSLGSGLGSSLGSALGSSFIPRRIDIQIRRGSSTTPNANQEERGDTQSASGQRNAGENSINQANSRVPEESGVRIVPIRSMVATIPGAFGRPSEPSGNSIGLYYPVLGRFQHSSSGQANNEVGPQSASQHHTEQHLTPESTLQRQSTDSARNGTSSTPDTRQEPSNTRVVHINIMTAGGAPQNNQESERQLPSSVLQFFRALFPGGEVHLEDSSLQGTNVGSTSEHAATSRDAAQVPEAEPTVSDEGIFLSNILREIMPVISQQIGSEGNPSEDQLPRDMSTEVETNAGTSRRRTGSESTDPNPKRQKME